MSNRSDIQARMDLIENLVARGETERAITRVLDMSQVFGNRDQRSEATVLMGRFKSIRREARLGVSPQGEINRRLNELAIAALQLVEEIASLQEDFVDAPAPRGAGGRGTIYVSYAWADEDHPERDMMVDRLVADARAGGKDVQRDKDVVSTGDRISKFMDKIGDGDRVVVILSAKYLRSSFCMYELYRIWLTASGRDDAFAHRIAVYAYDDADVWSLEDRAGHAKYWRELYATNLEFLGDMGERDRIAHLNMKKFSAHVGDILSSITDTVLPKSYEELLAFILRDGE